MQFETEKKISNFVRSQFPQFYNEEGETFILFVKAYYEWLEQEGNVTTQARSLQNYRNIDTTLDEFLIFFQKKYLYGIPANIISDKRFLLKHIQDVYRSKGSVQGMKLLFRLLYNEEAEVYLPGRDVLRASAGTWVLPKYVELSRSSEFKKMIGMPVIGVSSKTTALIESIVEESYNSDTIYIAHLSNILPTGGDFLIGEKITLAGTENDAITVSKAPSVLGSLAYLDITSGGKDFEVGDVLKISTRDVLGKQSSYGVEGLVRVTEVTKGKGTIDFNIVSGGIGFSANASTFFYKNGGTGSGASFKVGVLVSTELTTYNTDLICDYANLTIGATSFGFPLNPTGNQASTIGSMFSYQNNTFGTIFTLDQIIPGNNYTQQPNLFVRSTIDSQKPLTGTISYNSGSNNVTGTATSFTTIFANNDVIGLKSNTGILEYGMIRQVVSDTSIILYGPPVQNSTANGLAYASPVVYPANFALYDSKMNVANGSINGTNEQIIGLPTFGDNVAAKALALDSGKGYVQQETVRAYLYSAVSNNITITSGGLNYSNNDVLVFSGGSPGTSARGIIGTDANGSVTSASLTFAGSGYIDPPNVVIKSDTGSGAILSCTLGEFNTASAIDGRVVKQGIGVGRGFYSTTKGFLNSDKVIQDSYYYQNMSYEIRTAQTLNKYKDILYNTFHVAGTELFGKFLLSDVNYLQTKVGEEVVTIT